MKIGMTIGDNDFQRTIEAFLWLFVDSAVASQLEWCYHGSLRSKCHAQPRDCDKYPPEPITKERVILLWNQLKVGLYLLVQRGFKHYPGNPVDEGHLAHVEKYLTITPSRIYLGDEVDAYIAKCAHENNNFNSEFSWVDTVVGKVSTR